eukprot:5385-Pyramimonas_sp.AAC.1
MSVLLLISTERADSHASLIGLSGVASRMRMLFSVPRPRPRGPIGSSINGSMADISAELSNIIVRRPNGHSLSLGAWLK